MNFLKSAVASAIAQGPPFPYTFGDKVDLDSSIWTLHNGTKRADGSDCSIFSYYATAEQAPFSMARNAVKKLRTLRHPGVIKVLDTVETETYIHIATERLVPLKWHLRRKSLNEATIKWGLFSVANTLKFINEEASSIHGMIRVSSVFTSESGEWKLGGFDVLSSLKEGEETGYQYISLTRDAHTYYPPEVADSGWEILQRNPSTTPDAYNFGVLVFESFNGSFTGPNELSNVSKIPKTMQQSYKRLINANPKMRISVGNFLDQGRRNGGFFQTPLIRLTEGIDSLGVKTEAERDEFLSELDDASEEFPEEFFQLKVLPELLKTMEFGGGGPKVFRVIMKIGSKLSDEYYNARITPVIVRLFASPDRVIRVCLLDNLPLMIDHLPDKVVSKGIYPQMVTGFTDTAPIVREQTVKAVLTIINKLSDRIINGELLRYLAKTSNDEQPGIRTNTTICLGKIAKNIAPGTREKVLSAAFVRSLRDPFIHARMAALMALTATSDIYTIPDVATKLLPGICPSLVDPEKLIRDQANRTMDVYLTRIRKHTSSMPDTVLPPPPSISTDGTSISRSSTPAPPLPSNVSGWAGWAMSSLTDRLATASGEIEKPAINPATTQNGRSTSAPPSPDNTRKIISVPTSSASASQLQRQALASQKSTSTSFPMSKSISSTTPLTQIRNSSTIHHNDDDNLADNNDDDDDIFNDAWADLANDDADFLHPSSASHSTITSTPTTNNKTNSMAPNPFADAGEPDFAAWLTAQHGSTTNSSKLSGGRKKELPKGLVANKKKGNPIVGSSVIPRSGGEATTPNARMGGELQTKKKDNNDKKKVIVDLKVKDEEADDDDDGNEGWGGDGW